MRQSHEKDGPAAAQPPPTLSLPSNLAPTLRPVTENLAKGPNAWPSRGPEGNKEDASLAMGGTAAATYVVSIPAFTLAPNRGGLEVRGGNN